MALTKKCLLSILLATCGLAMLSLSGCGQDDENTTPPAASQYDFASVDALLSDYQDQFNGSVLVLVMRDDSLIYEQQLGNLSSQSKIPVASASKWVSGAVILALNNAGVLDIHHPVVNYLPEFDTTYKDQITPFHCFSLQSGIRECTGLDATCITSRNDITLREAAAEGAHEQQVALPGTALYYGSLSMEIAGAAAEVASGKDWESLLQEYIAVPCGMSTTDFGNGLHAKVAGGMRTTASDYLRFLTMVRNNGIYNGERVLSGEAVETMFSAWTLDKPVIYSPYPHNPPFHPYAADTIYYGFGGWMDVINPATNEVEQMSSPGAFGTYPWIDRKRRLSAIIFTFSTYQEVVAEELEIIQAIRDAVDTYDQ